MSDPLYLAAKMALFQFRVMDSFTPKARGDKFEVTIQNLQNAIEAYEIINKQFPAKEPERFDRNTGSYATLGEEVGQ